MKTHTHKLVLAAAIFLLGSVLLNSCSKRDEIQMISSANTTASINAGSPGFPVYWLDPFAPMFDQHIFLVSAIDDGDQLIKLYRGYVFYLTRNKTNTGMVTVTIQKDIVYGVWTLNDAGDRMTLSFPTNQYPELDLLNEEWMVDTNVSPLDPTDVPQTITLVPANGENDMLRFANSYYAGPR